MKTNSLVLCAALLAGCGSGPGVVHLTVDANPPVANIDHFHIEVVNNGMTSHATDLPLSGRPLAIPPAHTVDLTFSKDRSGLATIAVDAVDASGKVLASGSTSANIDQTKDTSASLTLGGPVVAASDMAVTAPVDMAAAGPVDMAGAPPADLVGANPPDLLETATPDMTGIPVDMVAVIPPDMTAIVPPDMVFVPDLTMLPPPVVTNAMPPKGPTTGMIALTITGSSFAPGAAVTIAGAPATNVVVKDSKTITCTLPANPGKSGFVEVKVTNSDGRSGSIGNAFSYFFGTVGFVSGKSFAVGTAPNMLVTGDFNMDGKPDVAVTNSTSADVSVLLANGQGTVAAAVSYPLTGGGRIVLGDLNKDGHSDLVVVDSASGKFNVLLGKGDGTFSAPKVTVLGARPICVVIGDFNKDGISDVLTTNNGNNLGQGTGLYFSQGLGDGTFQPALQSPSGGDLALAAADLDHDGKLDAATASSVVNEVFGAGDGTFQAPAAFKAGPSVVDVGIADLNMDGKPDVVSVNNGGNTVGVFTNSGQTLNPVVNVAVGAAPKRQTIGDLNGDGVPDIVVTNFGDNTVSILMGNGDGTFKPQVSVKTGNSPMGVAIADFDADGRPDLVVANSGDDNVLLLLNVSQ